MKAFTARAIRLAVDHIDTDQIIAARYLKGTTREGLGEVLFADWRKPRPDGTPGPAAALDDQSQRETKIGPSCAPHGLVAILVAGANFGCGSSREHAVWALTDFGFRAIIARSFADIFRQNALKNGLIPIAVDAAHHEGLLKALAAKPDTTITIDLATCTWRAAGSPAVTFAIDPFSQRCLLEGIDEIGYILSHEAAIGAFEQAQRI